MCEKKKYCSREIDECIRKEVESFNNVIWKTLASCCGHGKYTKTIVIQNKLTGNMFERFTGIKLNNIYKNGKKRKRFYKKDKEGYYYIPEVEERIKIIKRHKTNI